MHNKILIIDGTWLIYKSFYAIYYSANKGEKQVNYDLASKNFFNQLFNVLEYIEATHLFLAFDPKGPTYRHAEYQEYKSGRASTPEGLHDQLKKVRETLDILKWQNLDVSLYEADDLIGSLSKKIKSDPLNEIFIFSSDRDLHQLVDENISVITKKNAYSDYEILSIHNFHDIHDITPNQVPDLKGLSGDASDNLKGVPGIGPITAKKLINEYQTLENVYNNIESIKNEKLKNSLLDNKEEALRCKRLAIINRDYNLNFELNDILINLHFTHEILEDLKTKYSNDFVKRLLGYASKSFYEKFVLNDPK